MNNTRVVFFERDDGIKGFQVSDTISKTPEVPDIGNIRKTATAEISQKLVNTLLDASKTPMEEVEKYAEYYLEKN